MTRQEIIAKLDLKQPYVWISTWFGCGLIPGAPGTWGTLGALPFGILILKYGQISALGMACMLVLLLGYITTERFEKATESHDSSMIVIDEVAGIWLTLMFASGSLASFALAFLLFRVFDVLKPWPVSWGDRQPGAFGVMADDVVAGLMAGLVLGGLHYAGLG